MYHYVCNTSFIRVIYLIQSTFVYNFACVSSSRVCDRNKNQSGTKLIDESKSSSKIISYHLDMTLRRMILWMIKTPNIYCDSHLFNNELNQTLNRNSDRFCVAFADYNNNISKWLLKCWLLSKLFKICLFIARPCRVWCDKFGSAEVLIM